MPWCGFSCSTALQHRKPRHFSVIGSDSNLPPRGKHWLSPLPAGLQSKRPGECDHAAGGANPLMTQSLNWLQSDPEQSLPVRPGTAERKVEFPQSSESFERQLHDILLPQTDFYVPPSFHLQEGKARGETKHKRKYAVAQKFASFFFLSFLFCFFFHISLSVVRCSSHDARLCNSVFELINLISQL